MRLIKEIQVGIQSLIRRKQLLKAIRHSGGRISGTVKLTVSSEGDFTFGKALYLNGSGITAAKRMQIIVCGGG